MISVSFKGPAELERRSSDHADQTGGTATLSVQFLANGDANRTDFRRRDVDMVALDATRLCWRIVLTSNTFGSGVKPFEAPLLPSIKDQEFQPIAPGLSQ